MRIKSVYLILPILITGCHSAATDEYTLLSGASTPQTLQANQVKVPTSIPTQEILQRSTSENTEDDKSRPFAESIFFMT